MVERFVWPPQLASAPCRVSLNHCSRVSGCRMFADKTMLTKKPFVLVLTAPNWFTPASGVLLELNRRGSDFCVVSASVAAVAADTFLPFARFCDQNDVSLPACMVLRDAARGLVEMLQGSYVE